MNNGLEILLFLVLPTIGIPMLIYFLICAYFNDCKKTNLRNFGIVIAIVVVFWKLFGENPDVYIGIAAWAIMLSLIVAGFACVVLAAEVVSILCKENKDKKAIYQDALMVYLYVYCFVFILFFSVAFKDKEFILLLNNLDIFKKYQISINFSSFKVAYSLIYLWAYVLMTNKYIKILKAKKEERKNNNLPTIEIQGTIDDLIEILNRIDLPLAFSFLIFSIIFFLIRFSNYNPALDYFGYGGTSLHIFTSTAIFLYSYGEEYFNLNFIKLHRN